MRPVGRDARGGSSGEVPVRTGGVRAQPVPEPAQSLRPPAAASAVFALRVVGRHRAALLCATGGQDAHRNAHPRHAAVGQQLQLALRARPVAPPCGRGVGGAAEVKWSSPGRACTAPDMTLGKHDIDLTCAPNANLWPQNTTFNPTLIR